FTPGRFLEGSGRHLVLPQRRERRCGVARHEPAPLVAALARLYWMFLGNGALVLLAGALLHEPAWSWRDATFFATAASIILVRAVDSSRLGGLTAEGQPSTTAHVRRHAWLVALSSSAAWVAAKAIARSGVVPS
ncbi:MAG TPA: hypothetical protein VFO11_00470, partial [Candidatus Polarisedimenticolaceae bacterium]|nr:hypothetical protein [Candidatus Polarisedimenticolaceae bacterium]